MSGCKETGLSTSYAYKKGCRCVDCRESKAVYTRNEGDKARQRSKAWHQANPKRMKQLRKKSLDKRWLEKYGELFKAQNGKCAICLKLGGTGLTNGKRLHLDHDHKTGKIRGLLCGSCNVALGHFHDSIQLLNSAISYLIKGDVWL